MASIKARAWALAAAGLAVLLALALAWGGIERSRVTAARANLSDYKSQVSEANRKAEVAARIADAENRTIEFNRLEATNAAIQSALNRATAAEARTAALRTDRDGLRSDRATALAAATSDVSSDPLGACRRYAAAIDAVLGDVEATGAEIAGKADGHASDALMLLEAWPKR